MRILHIPDGSIPLTGAAATPSPAPDLGRVETLEQIAKSIFQKIQKIEDRIKTLEQTPPQTIHPPLKGEGVLQIALDTDALKKDLFTKMWKYLNDKAAA